MTALQRREIDSMLRNGPMDLRGDLAEQRRIFAEMVASLPRPDDVRVTDTSLGGVDAVAVDIPSVTTADAVLLYLHGGAYVQGSASTALGMASDLARRTGHRVVSLDYRLAPENPFPAALDDAVAAYRALIARTDPARVALVGESAGGGLALATLLALRDAGAPLPAAAVVFSPWADLTLSGSTIESHAAADPSVSPDGLRLRAEQYAATADPRSPGLSPVFGDLTGLPPLLIQSGGNEVLLDDSLRVAATAATAGVDVTLQVTPDVPHIFQAFAAILDEGSAALDDAARFVADHLAHG